MQINFVTNKWSFFLLFSWWVNVSQIHKSSRDEKMVRSWISEIPSMEFSWRDFYLTRNLKSSSPLKESYECLFLLFVLTNSDKNSESATALFKLIRQIFIEQLLCIGTLSGAWDIVKNKTKILALEKLTFFYHTSWSVCFY